MRRTLVSSMVCAGLAVESLIRLTRWAIDFASSRTDFIALLHPGEAGSAILLVLFLTSRSLAPAGWMSVRLLCVAIAFVRVATTVQTLIAFPLWSADRAVTVITGLLWPLVVVGYVLSVPPTSWWPKRPAS